MDMESSVIVSVIMPVYNVEKYIKRAVDSVLMQSFQDFEIILVDDGSTDSSLEICRHYTKNDARIKTITKKNGGVGSARNMGLDIAKGTYIYFMDPDDSIEKDLLKDNIALARQYDCDEVIFGYVCEVCDEQDDCIQRVLNNPTLSGLYDFEAFQKIYLQHLQSVPQTVWNRIYKKCQIGNIRFSQLRTAEDAIFNIEIYNKTLTSVYYNQRAYYTYYGRMNSLMNQYNPKRFANEVLITDHIWEMIRSWKREKEFFKYLSYRYMQSCLNEYNNMTMPDCMLTDQEIVQRMKDIFAQQCIVEAVKALKVSDIPHFSAKICYALSKRGHFHLALLFRRMHTPISRFLHRIYTRIKGN